MRGQNADRYTRWIFLRAIDAQRGRLEVGFFRFEYIRDKFLRIAIDQGEPGALHLHHDPVPFFEDVIGGVQIDGERRDGVRLDRFGLFE